MILAQEAKNELIKALLAIYDEREAENIAAIIFEDVFFIKNFNEKIFLTEENFSTLLNIKNRLLQSEPLQYVLGNADFYGNKFKVNPSVLIPRAETEELVYHVINHIKSSTYQQNPVVLDIGTGSGCIPITIKQKLPSTTVFACDISTQALQVAQANADALATVIQFIQADILDESQWKNSFEHLNFDIIISNPPYIAHDESRLMPKYVLDYEPHLALFVDNDDTLLFYKKIIAFAKQFGKPNTAIFFECNEYNAIQLENYCIEMGLSQVKLIKDMSGKNRILHIELKV